MSPWVAAGCRLWSTSRRVCLLVSLGVTVSCLGPEGRPKSALDGQQRCSWVTSGAGAASHTRGRVVKQQEPQGSQGRRYRHAFSPGSPIRAARVKRILPLRNPGWWSQRATAFILNGRCRACCCCFGAGGDGRGRRVTGPCAMH